MRSTFLQSQHVGPGGDFSTGLCACDIGPFCVSCWCPCITYGEVSYCYSYEGRGRCAKWGRCSVKAGERKLTYFPRVTRLHYRTSSATIVSTSGDRLCPKIKWVSRAAAAERDREACGAAPSGS